MVTNKTRLIANNNKGLKRNPLYPIIKFYSILRPKKPNISYLNESVSTEDCIKNIRKAISEYEHYLIELNESIYVSLSIIATLIFLFIFVLLIKNPDWNIKYFMEYSDQILPSTITAVPLLYSLWSFLFQTNISKANQTLKVLKADLKERILDTYEGKRHYIFKKLHQSKLFFNTISEDSKRLTKVTEYISSAQQCINLSKEGKEETEKVNYLNEADDYLSEIERLLNSEKKEKDQQKYLKKINIGIIILYTIVLLVVMIISSGNKEIQNANIAFFDTPVWALVSGGLGSLAAILYKFYSETKKVSFEQEFRWLFARPAIGIVMSIIAYHVFYAGSIFFGDYSSATSDDINKGAALMFCFIVSFSDRALEAIIEKLIDTTIRKDDSNNESQDKQALKYEVAETLDDKD